MIRFGRIWACASLLAAAACVTPGVMADTATQFAEDASGRWHSGEQSQSEDYDFVASEMTRVMPERTDGVWVFQQNWILGESPEGIEVEKGLAEASPYFQVVIQFRDVGDGAMHTTTHRLVDQDARIAARAVGAGNSEAFDPNWIGEVACMGQMQRIGEGVWTGGASCPNGYKGGVKVESRSVRTPVMQVNWDRGYNAAGEHIWGPADGGYIFKRYEPGSE